ncbi:5972_t:CDS:1 [Paraglomus brasilianum]|uniref:5972_t:CDS:1 n=1 Tax=Paraglomus brasilianum TaxID=144538 RepID=A0A9N9F475_9GLOM|nr:5972_t:CDS:1 [Paraglomus brasilianum]
MVHRAWPYAKIGTVGYVDMGSSQTNTPRLYGWKDNEASGSNHEFIRQWRKRTVAISLEAYWYRKPHNIVSVTKSFNYLHSNNFTFSNVLNIAMLVPLQHPSSIVIHS